FGGREGFLGRVELRFADPEIIDRDTVESQGQRSQRGVASSAHAANDVRDGFLQRRVPQYGRSLEHPAAFGARQGVPVMDFDPQSAHQDSIFSTGSTSSELAPAFLRFSRVSQNTFSRHTACTATLSPSPSSGITVGYSEPGSSAEI